jgi:hypothetical protein
MTSPPPGVKSNLDNPPSKAQDAQISAYVTLIVMFIFGILRIHERVRKNFMGLDDYIFLFAGVTSVVSCALTIKYYSHEIYARHALDREIRRVPAVLDHHPLHIHVERVGHASLRPQSTSPRLSSISLFPSPHLAGRRHRGHYIHHQYRPQRRVLRTTPRRRWLGLAEEYYTLRRAPSPGSHCHGRRWGRNRSLCAHNTHSVYIRPEVFEKEKTRGGSHLSHGSYCLRSVFPWCILPSRIDQRSDPRLSLVRGNGPSGRVRKTLETRRPSHGTIGADFFSSELPKLTSDSLARVCQPLLASSAAGSPSQVQPGRPSRNTSARDRSFQAPASRAHLGTCA